MVHLYYYNCTLKHVGFRKMFMVLTDMSKYSPKLQDTWPPEIFAMPKKKALRKR